MSYHAKSDPASRSCPDPQELAAFDCGQLSGQHADQITAHIQSCETCQTSHFVSETESQEVRQSLVGAFSVRDDVLSFVDEEEYVQVRNDLLTNPEPIPDGPWLDETIGTTAGPPLSGKFPFRFGGYQMLEQIGQGAMGVVYRAQHLSLKRMVALKVLAPGRLSRSCALARFRREMEAVGRLNHPHIVTAHDAGEVDGCHFLVTEYVEGFDLSTLVDRLGPLAIAQACELVRQAALGLQSAHEQGMVHHDIKPSNLMVTPQGQVKVLDLGLVSFMSETADDERDGEVQMGTPDYMAPERWLNSRNIDIRADVYSLGCTLFKLLVGHAPFSQRQQTVDDKAHRHVSGAVPSLGRLRGELPAALQHAVYRMLAKSPDDRYGTPAEVARVLEPFAHDADLAGLVSRARTAQRQRQPEIETKPQTAPRLASIGRRVRTIVVTVAAAAAIWCGLVVYAVTDRGTVIVTVFQDDVKVTLDGQRVHIQSPRDELSVSADDHVLMVEKEGFATYTRRFVMARGGRREFEVTLEQGPDKKPPGRFVTEPKLAVARPPLGNTIRPLARLTGHTASVPCVAVSPDGTQVVSASVDKTIRLWDLLTQAEIHRFTGHTGKVVSVVFSPDATRIASASHDGTVRLWDVETGDQTHRLQAHRGWVNRVDFSPDGQWLVSGGEDGLVRVWDSITGNLEQSLAGHTHWIRSVAFSPAGHSVISCGNDATAILWDLRPGGMRRVYQGHSQVVTHAVVSSDQRHVLSGSLDRTARLWDRKTQQPVRVLSGHLDTVFAVAFLPGDQHAITASADHTLALWDLASGRKLTTFPGHSDFVLSVSVSPDGRFFVSSGQDRTIRLWPVPILPDTSTTPVQSAGLPAHPTR